MGTHVGDVFYRGNPAPVDGFWIVVGASKNFERIICFVDLGKPQVIRFNISTTAFLAMNPCRKL